MTLTVDNPQGLLWLFAAAAIVAIGISAALWRRRAALRFADSALLARVAPGLSLARGIWRAILLGGAAVCLAAALMDPRASERTEELTRRGADVMFVVDVSRSMLAEDATPNRLERARTFISDAIDAMGGDRAGLIDFAGVAAVRAPLTLNYDALKSAVDGLEPKDSRRGGSMLGDAIRLAAESFPTDDAGHAIVILSDGEDMGSDPVDAAKEAAELGIRIITVGIGDPREGARIPVGDGPSRRFLVHEGEEVWSRMDSATLRDVADATGGLFVPAATAQVELGEILTRALSDLDRTEGDASIARTTAPLFQWPAGLALALVIAESLISARMRRTPAPTGASVPVPDEARTTPSSPAPRARRRMRERSLTGTAAAALAAVAAAAWNPSPTRADSSGTPGATAPEQPAPAKRPRTVGRGQIDRAAFRDAITRANAAMRAGQYVDAATAFAEAMDADPTSAAAAYNRGVAEYRAGKLDESAESFAEAASRGDAALAADAMFNQGNATYQSALRALKGGAPDSGSAAPDASQPGGAGEPSAQPDLKAATEAVSQALTHYKDAIAANRGDADSRANAELAHTLLKQLREMQQQQQQDQQEKQQGEDSSTQDQEKQSESEQQKDGESPDNPQKGDGTESPEQSQGQKGADGDGSQSESAPQPEESDPKDGPKSNEGSQGTEAKDDGQKQTAEGARSDETKDGKGAEESKGEQDGAERTKATDRDSGGDGKDETDAPAKDGEVKAINGSEQPKTAQQPPTPAQARAGEPVPGAPLTKSEAERLLQGVRDRAKQRMEAKERAERVRQVPAVRDW